MANTFTNSKALLAAVSHALLADVNLS